MRNFLTFIAVALVTALTVALVAPPFIDWSARRQMVAHAIAARVGAPVEINGPVTLRLLPTPYLEAAGIAFGARGAPWLQAKSMRIEFALANLIDGKIKLDDVVFESPQIRLGPALTPPAEGPLEFGHIRAEDADISIERGDGSALVLSHVNFEGSTRSARGPWRGAGDFALSDGASAHFDLASETFDGDALPLKADVSAGATHVAFDGRLVLAATPAFAGALKLSGETDAPEGGRWPWSVVGDVEGQEGAATMANAELRLGSEARRLEAQGRLSLLLGARPELTAALTAKSLNFDALLRREKETFAPPARAAAAFAALASQALKRDAALAKFSLKLESDGAYLGARALEAPRIALSGAPEGAMRLELESGLPGHSRVKLDGDLELGAAPIFRGRAEGGVGDFAPLAAWAAEGDSALGSRLTALGAALPAGEISGAAKVEASREGYAARGLSLAVGPSHFNGGLVYRLPSANDAGRLFLDLSTDALDIDEAPNVEAGLAWLGDTDLEFRLTADKLRVARVGLATVQSGSLAVRARKDGQKFTLQKLSLANFGGASIEAEGETSPSGRWTRLKLDAAHLGDMAALLARAVPGSLSRWFEAHADALGAAKATFEARRDGPPLAGPFPLDFLKADGVVDASRLALTISRAPAPVDAVSVQASLDSPDAGALLRKLGANFAPGPAGRAQLSLTGAGQWDRGFEGKAQLALAGTELTWTGALRPESGDAWLSGPLAIKSADVLPALAALGMGTAGQGAAAVDLTAAAEAGLDSARFGKIAGALAGAHVSGDLEWRPRQDETSLEQLAALAQQPDSAPADPKPAPTLTGNLALDRASLGGLFSLALGRPAPLRPGALWSDVKFGPALTKPPQTEIMLKIGALDTGFGAAQSVSARFSLDRDRLSLDDIAAAFNGGAAKGRLNLRRDPSGATVSGALDLQGVGVDRPNGRARFDAGLDFAGSGGSAAALVGGLAGAGHLKIGEAKIDRLDPQALARVFSRIEQTGDPTLDGKKLQTLIEAELAKGPLTLSGVESPLALSSGAVRFGPLQAPLANGALSVSGALSLSDATLNLEATLTDAKVGRLWSGSPPSVTVTDRGALDASAHGIANVSLLAAGLAAEAIARENERIENFEADVRERAAFNRRLKAERFLARREAEIDAFEQEQARRRLMELYLGPYREWAASHSQAPDAR